MQYPFRLLVVLLGVIGLLMGNSCQGPGSSTNAVTDGADNLTRNHETSPEVTSCYRYTHGRDSVHLMLTTNGDTISGTLHFRNYQIDGSQGTVRGQFSGDTLFVRYDFHAEGTDNITEEAFLKRGGTLIRGFGDRSLNGHIYRFTDRNAIDFSEGQVFQPVSCTKKE